MSNAQRITAIILAGGRGQRMGEVDKGLQLLQGRPMVSWVADRIAPQVDEVLISANRNLEVYQELGHRVLRDDMPQYPGPLAGLHRVMKEISSPLWLSVPCDTPFLPTNLVQSLFDELSKEDAKLAVATVEGWIQPTICLGYTHLCAGLGDFIASGGRRVGEWQSGLRRVAVPFEGALRFRNINTLAELAEAENSLNG